jgi:dihydrofolate reductase
VSREPLFAAYWPTAPEEEQVIAEPLNKLPKYVASRNLSEPLAWENSHLLTGDVPDAVAALKREDGKDLQVVGSPAFAQTLIEHDLVDEYRLMIDPVVIGTGKRLLRKNGGFRPLQLVEGIVTSAGAILATYAVA